MIKFNLPVECFQGVHWRGRAYIKTFNQIPWSPRTIIGLYLTFVNINDNFYFSEENDNQKGSVEEQLSIMKAIFLGGKSTFIAYIL